MEVNYSKLSDYGITLEIENGILFYPCCDDDIAGPINLFQNYICKYYFVDTKFFYNRYNNHEDRFEYLSDSFKLFDNYQIRIPSAPQTISYEKDFKNDDPRIFRFVFERNDNEFIEVNLYKRHGIFALYYLEDNIDIFFYRNDSIGWGGSYMFWNTHPSITLVLGKLNQGGYIITDGSNSFGSHGDFRFIRILERDTIDIYGNYFEFLGKFENNNRVWDNNKVWRIWKNPDLENNERFIRDIGLCKKMFLHL